MEKSTEHGKTCKARVDGTFTDAYQIDQSKIDSLADLRRLEVYDPGKCVPDYTTISDEIDAILKRYGADCVKNNNYNKSEYSSPSDQTKFKSARDFEKSNRFDSKKCVIDASKLRGDLLSEFDDRKKRCVNNKGDVVYQDYRFPGKYTIPEEDDILNLTAIQSLQNFKAGIPYNEHDCVVDEHALRKALEAEFETRKGRCAKERGSMNTHDYAYDVPEEMTDIVSLKRFNEDILPYSNEDCILDESSIKKLIDLEVRSRSAMCKKLGFSDAYSVVIPDGIKHIDEFNDRPDTRYNADRGCVVDKVLLKSQLDAEFKRRHGLCKAEGYVEYGKQVPGDNQLGSIGTIARYVNDNPIKEVDCVIDAALVTADIDGINSSREQTCKRRGFAGYAKPNNLSVEKWRKPGNYGKGSAFKVDANCMVDNKTDRYGRYFTHAPTPTACDSVNGIWSGSSINREGLQESGQCWATHADAACGKIPTDAIVRGSDTDKTTEVVATNRKNCQNSQGCGWVDMSLHPECVTKSLLKAREDDFKPPTSPPLDAKNPEKRIYDHFMHTGPDGRPPPMFSPLEGDADEDRCPPQLRRTQYETAQIEAAAERALKQAGGRLENVFVPGQGKADFTFTLPQSVIHLAMKDIAKRPNNVGGNRGMLVWHSTGSGKLFCGVACMEAFWDSGRTIVFASTLENNKTNPDVKYHEGLVRFFPRFNNPSLTFKENVRIMSIAYKERGVRHYSFAKLSNRIVKGESGQPASKSDPNIDLDNSVLIIDEIQNLFSARSGQQKHHEALEEVITERAKRMKIMILTATPGDNSGEAVRLLNLVRDPTKPEIKAPTTDAGIPAFKLAIRGLISYFDASGDKTKFPQLKEHDKHRYPMADAQFVKYKEKHDEVNKDGTCSPACEGTLRKYSNMPYPEFPHADFKSMPEYSAKLQGLLDVIKSYPNENHYVYSAFFRRQEGTSSHGVRAIGSQLRKVLNYQQISFGKCKEVLANLRRNVLYGGLDPNVKRYVVVTDSDLVPSTHVFADQESEGFDKDADLKSSADNLAIILAVYNSFENKDGKLIHVFVASQKYNESNDFRSIRHIHIFEPLVSMVSDIQTIGRGRRNCSHSSLTKDQWTVNVHRYFSDKPDTVKVPVIDTARLKHLLNEVDVELEKIKGKRSVEAVSSRKKLNEDKKSYKTTLKGVVRMNSDNVLIIDQKIYDNAIRNMKVMQLTTIAMKESAIDCSLLTKFHHVALPADQQFKCTNWG